MLLQKHYVEEFFGDIVKIDTAEPNSNQYLESEEEKVEKMIDDKEQVIISENRSHRAHYLRKQSIIEEKATKAKQSNVMLEPALDIPDH